MTNPVLDDNLKQLFRHCAAQPNPDAVDRALARVEGRNPSPSRQGRLLVAAAAAVLVALVGWMVLPKTPPPPQPAAQEDVARLIADLGSATPDVREKARKSLLAMGPAALAPLERAVYHEDPEVRLQAQDLAKVVRRAADIQGTLAFVRAAIKIARARWTARNFDKFDEMIREAFEPETLPYVHYVPKKTVGAAFDTLKVLDGGAATLPGLTGGRDTLTAEMVDVLNREGGIAFVGTIQTLADLSQVCVFTLPDKVGWSAYVVVELLQIHNLDPVLMRFGLSADDLASFLASLRMAGGNKIADFDEKNALAAAFRKGDLLKAVNGVPATGSQDLLQLSRTTDRPHTVTVDRDGKVFAVEFYRTYPAVIRKSELPPAETEARKLFEEAEKAVVADPDRALQLYRQLMADHGKTELVSKMKKAFIEERIAALEARKARDKK